MKISYSDYIKKTDVSVLIAEAIFSVLESKYPAKYISEVAETTSGGTPLRSNSDFHDGNIPWLKSGELNDGQIEKAEEFITEKGLSNSSAKLFPINTLLLAMYGATAGRTGITKIEAATNQAVCALFPNEKVTQEYLFWFLRQHRYKFIEISKGGAQPNISQSVINETKIAVPEIKLQKQITDLLTKIESEGILDISIIPKEFREKVNKVFISKNNVFEIDSELTRQLSLLNKLRQELLQDAVQGKLVKQNKNDEPASTLLKKIKVEKEKLIAEKKLKKEKELPHIKLEDIPFRIPENWVWCKISEIAKNEKHALKAGPFGSSLKKEFYVSEGYKIYGQEQVINQDPFFGNYFINEERFQKLKSCQVKAGDILISLVGTMGKVLILPDNIIKGIINPRLVKISLYETINRAYIKWFLYSNASLKQINHYSHGSTMDIINLGIINKILIPIPPVTEQERIVQKLEQLMQYCNELEESIKQSATQNEKLLQQVLREALRKVE